MTGEPPGTGELIIYIDHSTIHEDRIEDLEARIRRLVDAVTAIHPDSASLELHMRSARSSSGSSAR